jgi:hypothetical protein
MQELVEAGLMRSLGRKSFAPDEYFGITRAGRTALAITSTGATCSAAEDGDADRVSNNNAKVKLQPVTYADDLDRKGMLLQLATAQQVSKETAFASIGIEPREEQRRVTEIDCDDNSEAIHEKLLAELVEEAFADDKEDTPSTTLEELLRMTVESEDAEGNPIQITPEFRLSVQEVRPNGGGVRFLIHANGHNSDTLDFKVYGDTVLVIPPPQPVKCDCADGNAGEVCEDPECVGCRNNPAPVKQPESGRHVNQVYSHANTGIEFTIKGAWDGKYPERNHAFLIRSDGTGHAYIGATTKVASVWDISEEEFHTMTGGRPEWFSLVSGVPQYKKGLTPTSELTEPPPQRSFEERLLGAVRDVAKQHTVEELGLMGNDADGADYAGAYDIMIMAAREVLKEQ